MPDSFSKYERTFQMIRDQFIPKNPATCAEITNVFSNEDVMAKIGRSKLDKSDFFDGAFERDEYKFCVFSSKHAINLYNKIEPGRQHLMLDATFKVCPIGPFRQLWIFYAAIIGKTFPIIFVLMSHKSEAAYKHVLQFIKENISDLKCIKFSTDYETAMRNALADAFPEAQGVACWFHFTQAVKRYASQIPEFFKYVQAEGNEEAQKIYYKLLCLPLLPAKHIVATFDALKREAFDLNKTQFSRFMSYYRRQWILKVSLYILFMHLHKYYHI